MLTDAPWIAERWSEPGLAFGFCLGVLGSLMSGLRSLSLALGHFTMRQSILIVLAGLLVGCATSHSPRQQAGKPYDPTIPASPPGCIPVIISFAGDEWMDADELKHKAKQRLKDEGHQLDDSYQCRINVELIGKGVGCTVGFSKGFGDKIYFVEFDAKGKIQKVRTGVAVEGRGSRP